MMGFVSFSQCQEKLASAGRATISDRLASRASRSCEFVRRENWHADVRRAADVLRVDSTANRERQPIGGTNMDRGIVKAILAVGVLNALAAQGRGLGETNREGTLKETLDIADRLFKLLFER